MTALSLVSSAQEPPKQSSGAKASQPFMRTAAPDPALPPVSMLARLLVLTPEQEQKVRQLFSEHNKSYGEILQQKLSAKERQEKLRELRKSLQKRLESVLTPQQLQKLRHLDPESMLVDRLTIALKLTEEQSTQLLEVMREQSAGIRAIEKQAQDSGWSEQQKKQKLAELRKQIEEKVNRILTPQQQQKLRQILQGEAEKPATPSKQEQNPAPE
jgi:Spy/CpxP family protein refolding chaperone